MKKKYNVLVTEDIKRFCEVSVHADTQEEAVEIAHKMWQDDKLDDLMANSELGSSFVNARIIN